jgi:hypothetical protein
MSGKMQREFLVGSDHFHPAMRERAACDSCERQESRARRAEEEGAEVLFLCERRRSRRILACDARAAQEMAA